MSTIKQLRDEYVSLLEQINSNLSQQVSLLTTKVEKQKPESSGVIYVLNREGTTQYKIGVSTNYQARLKTFEVKLPFNVKEIAVYKTDDFFAKERELHEYFSSKRLNGSEFFDLTDADLAEIPKIIYDRPIKQEPDDQANDDSDAELLEEARELILAEGKASTSFLQRKLRLGYTRASRIMDALEQEGLVGPINGNGAQGREVLRQDQ